MQFLILVVLPVLILAVLVARHRTAPRWIAPALGVIAAAATVVVGLISFTGWNPSDAVRIGVPLLGLITWIGAVALGVAALRRGDRLGGGIALALAVASVVAFIVMVNAAY